MFPKQRISNAEIQIQQLTKELGVTSTEILAALVYMDIIKENSVSFPLEDMRDKVRDYFSIKKSSCIRKVILEVENAALILGEDCSQKDELMSLLKAKAYSISDLSTGDYDLDGDAYCAYFDFESSLEMSMRYGDVDSMEAEIESLRQQNDDLRGELFLAQREIKFISEDVPVVEEIAWEDFEASAKKVFVDLMTAEKQKLEGQIRQVQQELEAAKREQLEVVTHNQTDIPPFFWRESFEDLAERLSKELRPHCRQACSSLREAAQNWSLGIWAMCLVCCSRCLEQAGCEALRAHSLPVPRQANEIVNALVACEIIDQKLRSSLSKNVFYPRNQVTHTGKFNDERSAKGAFLSTCEALDLLARSIENARSTSTS